VVFVNRLPSDQDASGRSFGEEELDLVRQVLASGTLTATKGRMARDFAEEFAAILGVEHAAACSSGTAAVHAAVAAIDPEPGEEIVTSRSCIKARSRSSPTSTSARGTSPPRRSPSD
jgi:dTDP-4-amino-4,6-dideoxygalactose transaminase